MRICQNENFEKADGVYGYLVYKTYIMLENTLILINKTLERI